MRTWTAVFLLAALALAGCAQEGDPAFREPVADPLEDDDGTFPDVGERPELANTPPTAAIFYAEVEPRAPVTVNFTLRGTDRDGDTLTWSFDADNDGNAEVGGSGSELPAFYAHRYDVGGNHTAVLVVSDGTNTTTVQEVLQIASTQPPEPECATGGTNATVDRLTPRITIHNVTSEPPRANATLDAENPRCVFFQWRLLVEGGVDESGDSRDEPPFAAWPHDLQIRFVEPGTYNVTLIVESAKERGELAVTVEVPAPEAPPPEEEEDPLLPLP